MNIPDQRVIWDEKHAAGEHAEFRVEPSPFGVEVESLISPNSAILDLGCGVGGDAMFFAQQGHQVLAGDFSKEVIDQDVKTLSHPNLNFVLLNIENLPINPHSLDVVFAHLSLHYYDDLTTQAIFNSIATMLKPDGRFAFACKSTKDPDFGRGTEVEANFFVSNNGHARHFFSEDYIAKLTEGLFLVEIIEESHEDYEYKSADFISCIARKGECEE